MDSLLTLLWFLVALGVLVTFHEFGHFYVARRCGVKVLRFSVGFGKPLCSWRDKSGTEFSLAGIPLGGYVKMLDEREGDVPPELRDQAFNNKSPWQKIAIVAAGPVANFILAVLLFWGLMLQGTIDAVPVVGKVEPGSLAARAGLEAGQEIVAIDGVETPTWQQLNRRLLQRLGESGTLSFSVRYPNSELIYDSEVKLDGWLRGAEEPDPVAGLGITLWEPQITLEINTVQEQSPAARAGVNVGDILVAADGQTLQSWQQWVEYVRQRPGTPIEVSLIRDGREQLVRLVPDTIEADDGAAYGRVGVAPKAETWPESSLRRNEYGIVGAFTAGVDRTLDTSGFVLLSLKKLILGEISTKNLSGPITIAKVAGASAKAGFGYYIGFLALLSVSLGVFNLLPIPVLDGGHLLYYIIELAKGSPVSERIQAVGQQIGLVMILGVMVLAFYNDVMRL